MNTATMIRMLLAETTSTRCAAAWRKINGFDLHATTPWSEASARSWVVLDDEGMIVGLVEYRGGHSAYGRSAAVGKIVLHSGMSDAEAREVALTIVHPQIQRSLGVKHLDVSTRPW